MKLREITVAVAALSLAGMAVAAGNYTGSSTGTSQGMSTPKMSGSNASTSGASGNASSQGSNMGNEEHNPQLVRQAQQALKQKGFDVGSVDGQMGLETENALRRFQQSQGLPQSGSLDTQTLSALGVNESQAGSTSSMGSPPSSQSSQGSQQSSQGAQSKGSSIHSSAYK